MITQTIKKNNRGFSMIEFIVVITIFSIMSGVSIFNYNSYRNSIETTNIAQDIALTIRQAQVYGLAASDGIVGGSSSDAMNITQDKSIRGVNIDPGTGTFVIYEDFNRNFVYDPGNDRIIDERTIKSNAVRLLGFDLDDAMECSDTANTLETDSIDIAFQRPYSDAFISLGNSTNQFNTISIVVGLNCVDDPSAIEITSLGNINVKNNYE